MKFGNIFVGKRLFVGCGKPEALGKGETEIRGSGYIEGPLQIGDDSAYDKVTATLMVGAEYNSDSETHPDKVIMAKGGDTYFLGNHDQVGNMDVSGNLTIEGTMKSGYATWDGSIVATSKLFDIEHPTKGEGYRLAHACLEGPEHGVYYRGRLKNEKVIRLPSYWKDLVNIDTISVQLQPIGAHQDIIVKRWDDEYIYLQAQGGLPINCFYHVYAERNDIDKLEVEYEG